MAIGYVMIRLPKNVFEKYWHIKRKMEDDLTKAANKPITLSFPQFFDSLVSLNENYIEIDIPKLYGFYKEKKRRIKK